MVALLISSAVLLILGLFLVLALSDDDNTEPRSGIPGGSHGGSPKDSALDRPERE